MGMSVCAKCKVLGGKHKLWCPVGNPEKRKAKVSPNSEGLRKPKKLRTQITHPPYRGRFTTKNAHTSASKIALARAKQAALLLREGGKSFSQIAAEMKKPVSTVYQWVAQALDAITVEPAERVLKMELDRLDAYLAAVHEHALKGELASIDMALKIMRERCRLLGLYPEMGRTSDVAVRISSTSKDDEPLQIEFVSSRHSGELPVPRDITPANTIDLEPNLPHSGVPLVRPHVDRSKNEPDTSLTGDALPDPKSRVPAFGPRGWQWR